MIKIAICDDNKDDITKLEELLSHFTVEGKSIYAVKYSSSVKLKKNIDKGEKFDIFLLDVVMPKVDGIDLGNLILEKLPNSKIIYISSSAEFAVLSYAVHAFYYLLKPIKREDFETVLADAIKSVEESEASTRVVKIATMQGEMVVKSSEIIYCMLENRRLKYVTKTEPIFSKFIRSNFVQSTEELIESGEFAFVTSFIVVNLSKVASIDGRNLCMENGESIKMSRGNITDFKKKYFDYYFNK